MKNELIRKEVQRLPPPLRPQRIRLWLAVFLVCFGMVLLLMGFWVAPTGEIHQSILIAYGEVMTFVGALVGIDYAARERYDKTDE